MSSTSLTVHVFAPAVELVDDVVTPSLLFAKVISTRRLPADMLPVGKYLLCIQLVILGFSRDWSVSYPRGVRRHPL